MLCTTKLSQHAVGQSKAGEVRHAIPACSNLDKLLQHAVSQLEARKSDMLSQDATETNHRSGKLDKLSQHTYTDMLSQHALHNLNCIKEATKAQNSRQADTVK